MAETDTGISGRLTDGTGIGTFTVPKIIKDLVLDFLLTVPAVFIGLQVADLGTALTMPVAIAIGVADAAIRVVYRALLKWSQTP